MWLARRSRAFGILSTMQRSIEYLRRSCPLTVTSSSSEECSDFESSCCTPSSLLHCSWSTDRNPRRGSTLFSQIRSDLAILTIYHRHHRLLSLTTIGNAANFSFRFSRLRGCAKFHPHLRVTYPTIHKQDQHQTSVQIYHRIMTHHPWISFSKVSINHSEMPSLQSTKFYKFWRLQVAEKRRPSHHALLTSCNTTNTNHGTSFVSPSPSRARGK